MARVSDILRGKGTDVLKIEASATVFEALEKLVEKNVGSILVTEGGEVTGIMTERDYLRKIAIKGRTSHDTLVREIMTSPLVYVTPETPVEETMAIMTDRRIRHLPSSRTTTSSASSRSATWSSTSRGSKASRSST